MLMHYGLWNFHPIWNAFHRFSERITHLRSCPPTVSKSLPLVPSGVTEIDVGSPPMAYLLLPPLLLSGISQFCPDGNVAAAVVIPWVPEGSPFGDGGR